MKIGWLEVVISFIIPLKLNIYSLVRNLLKSAVKKVRFMQGWNQEFSDGKAASTIEGAKVQLQVPKISEKIVLPFDGGLPSSDEEAITSSPSPSPTPGLM